jgi:hypothetical protein
MFYMLWVYKLAHTLPVPPVLQAQQLRAKIVTQDAYDLAGYKQLLDDLRGQSASKEVCAAYEELVAAFPTAVRAHPACLPLPACCM